MTEKAKPRVYAVILAGGAGTRLWPLARAGHPKQFLPLLGGPSLFSSTLSRLQPMIPPGRTVVVAGAQHAGWIRRQARRVPAANLILEGEGRNTAASIALAARWVEWRDPDAIMVVLPADHDIAPAASFRGDLRRAVASVAKTRGLMTLGIPPRSANSGFGYILSAGRSGRPGAISRVARFVEKPAAATAARMVRSGRYLWNSGIFVWHARTLLRALNRHRPDIAAAAESVPGPKTGSAWRIPAREMGAIPAAPIDRAVLERSGEVFVLRARFAWSDLGTWDAVADLLARTPDGNAGAGPSLAVDARNCLTVSDDGLIALAGVRDLIVVRSGDVVLVCPRNAAQKVRDLVHALRGPLLKFS